MTAGVRHRGPRSWGWLAGWWGWVDESSTPLTRGLITGGVVLVAWFPVVAGMFLAVVVGTGCLIGCTDEPRVVAGLAIGLLPTVIIGGVVALFPWVAGRSDLCRQTFLGGMVVTVALIGAAMILG